MMKNLLKTMLVAAGMLFTVNASAVTETYDFSALLNGGYTTINSSGTKSFEGKSLNVISSFTNTSGEVGANVGGRIAALYQGGNGNNFWMRDAGRPWFVSAGKTSFMAFDNLKAGDVVKIIGKVYPLTVLCDNAQNAEGVDIANGTALTQQEGTADNPIVLVAKADGYIYGSYGPYTAITKIIVESTAAETANDPIVTISAAKNEERTVTINANAGSAGTAQTAYYTLDGSEPTKASTEYTAPFTVSETTIVKAIAYCGEAASNVVTLEVEAGFAIKLNDAILKINAMQTKGSQFAPVYGVSVDNSQLIGAPTATLSATFLGEDVTADLVAGTFVPTANADLIVTSSAEGYETNTVKAFVFGTYNQTYASTDYSTLTDEASVQAVLGDEWAVGGPTRWANWNKLNATYGDQYYVYSYTGEAEGNIYLDKDNMLRGPKAIQFMESFGFGRGVSGATKVFIQNTGTPQDITLYRVINSKGANANTYTETFVKSAYIDGKSYSEFDIPGCETLCQAIIYSPVHTYSIVGDLTGGWDVDAEMTETSKDVYTLTVNGFKVELAGEYSYKLRADKTWGIYELPMEGDFKYEFKETGIYDLTFTANIAENLLTLTVKDVSPYTLVGAFEANEVQTAAFFGEAWNPEYAANDMTLQEDGTYTIEFSNVEFEAGTIWYKVVKNHSWDVNYGMADKKDGNAEYVVSEACKVNKITFTFNPAAEGYKVSCEFEGITTGINEIASDQQKVEIFNMAGQRVAAPVKGINIINGRKVVIK